MTTRLGEMEVKDKNDIWNLDLKLKTRLEFLEPVVRMFSDLWSRGEEEGEEVCWRTVWRPET